MLRPDLFAWSKPVCRQCASDGVLHAIDAPIMECGIRPPHQRLPHWDTLALPIELWLAPSSFLLISALGTLLTTPLMHVRKHSCRLPRLCHKWPQDEGGGLFSYV